MEVEEPEGSSEFAELDAEIERLSPNDKEVDQWIHGCILLVAALTGFLALLSIIGYLMAGMGT